MSRIAIFCYFLAITVNCTLEANYSNAPPTRTLPSSFRKLPNLAPSVIDEAEVENVYLRDEAIKTLRAGSLDKNSYSLDLSGNGLSEIEDGAFSGMKKLHSLNMAHNQLEEFRPGFLSDCRELNELLASHNKIRVIKSNTFSKSLHKIDLSHNAISEIEQESFPQTLWLSVDVSHNRLTSLRANTFSTFFSNINSFNASNNRIKIVEKNAFRNAPYFDKLDLSYNEISDLKNGSVCGIDSLAHLYLSHNHLTGEDLTVVVSCSKLEFLDISYNKIEHLEEKVFKNSTLQDLDLSGNKMLELDLSEFSEKYRSRLCVFLRHNDIKIVRGGVSGISILDLSDNKIEIVEPKTFKDVQLDELDLTNNQITSVGGETFNHELNELQLQHNKIKSFTNWFVGYPDEDVRTLEHLNVSYNEIERVETGALNNNYNVRELDLSHNKISEIAANAFNSTSLEKLHLDHNSLTGLKENVFNCSGLYFLNISFNKIKTIESGVFEDLNSLGYLDLSHNQVETLDFRFFANVPFFWGSTWFRIILEDNDKINEAMVEGFLFRFLNREMTPSLSINTTLDRQSCQHLNMKTFDFQSANKRQAYYVRSRTENVNECDIEVQVI